MIATQPFASTPPSSAKFFLKGDCPSVQKLHLRSAPISIDHFFGYASSPLGVIVDKLWINYEVG